MQTPNFSLGNFPSTENWLNRFSIDLHASLSRPVTVRSRNRKLCSPLAAVDCVLSTLCGPVLLAGPALTGGPRFPLFLVLGDPRFPLFLQFETLNVRIIDPTPRFLDAFFFWPPSFLFRLVSGPLVEPSPIESISTLSNIHFVESSVGVLFFIVLGLLFFLRHRWLIDESSEMF